MGAVITFGLAYGMIVCIIPLVIIIEIYHWLRKKNKMKWPFIFSIITSLLLSVAVISLLMIDNANSGESGLAGLAVIPFIFIGFATGGVLVGFLYKSIDRTILKRSSKE